MNAFANLPQFPWMSLLIMMPLCGALLCLLHGKRTNDCRGLALATALASYINAGLLYRQLRRDAVYRPASGWPRLLLQMMSAIGVMAVVVGWGAPGVEVLTSLTGMQRALQISLWIAAGVASYLLALRLAGVRLSLLWAPAAETGRKP